MTDQAMPDRPGLWWWRFVFTPPMQLVCGPELWLILLDEKTGELFGTAIREQDKFICDACMTVDLIPEPTYSHGGIQKAINTRDNRLFYAVSWMAEDGEFLGPAHSYREISELQRHAAALEEQVADLECTVVRLLHDRALDSDLNNPPLWECEHENMNEAMRDE